MLLEVINKVVHNKPKLRSILCNKKMDSKELSPYSLKSKIKL